MNRIVMMSICISMPCAGMIPGDSARPPRKSVTFADEERGEASSGALAGYGSLDAAIPARKIALSVDGSDVPNPIDVAPKQLPKNHPLKTYWQDSSSDDGEFKKCSCRCSGPLKACAAFCSTFGLCAGFLAYMMLKNHGEKPR